MVIGFDAKRLFCNNSGLGAYSRALVKNLISHHPNIIVHLYTPKVVSNEDTNFFINHPNIHIHTPPAFGALWRTFLIPFWFRHHKLQVYHGLSAELPFFTLNKNVKKVLTVHDLLFRSRPQDYSVIDRWIYDQKLKYSLKNSDEIICISEETKNELLRLYDVEDSNLKVVSPIVNPLFSHSDNYLKESEFKSLFNLKNGFWLYVGSLYGRKNVKIIIEALAHIPEKKRKKLVLVTNDDRIKIMNLARQSNVEDWVRIEPNVSDRTLSLYYKNCTAVVYPSLAEGFGLPILEGLYHGATVICSDIPIHRETGGGQCIYFDPDNANLLAEILTSLSYHERKTKKDTLSHLDTYNPDVICKKLIAIYEN